MILIQDHSTSVQQQTRPLYVCTPSYRSKVQVYSILTLLSSLLISWSSDRTDFLLRTFYPTLCPNIVFLNLPLRNHLWMWLWDLTYSVFTWPIYPGTQKQPNSLLSLPISDYLCVKLATKKLTFQAVHDIAMAGKKIWRDAATLILTAKAPGGNSLPSSFTR